MSDAHALYLARMSNAIVASGTVLGRGCVIHPFAIVGMQPMLHPTLARKPAAQQATEIGENVAIGPHAIVYAGTVIGDGTFIGGGASIREECLIGKRCVIGTHVTIGYDVTIGDDVKVQDGAHLTGGMVIGDETFIGLNVTTCNDARREIVDYEFVGAKAPVIGKRCLIGSGAVLLPGVRIGDGAVVGAGALVTRDVAPGATVLSRGATDAERQLVMLRSARAAEMDAQPVLERAARG